MRFVVVNVVWGGEYTQFFLQHCLPTLLSSGNLPALPPGSLFQIYTTNADAEYMKDTPAILALEEIMPVEFERFRAPTGPSPYGAMTACHNRALKMYADGEHAFIFLSPDLLIANGTLATVAGAVKRGKRALMITPLHLAMETALLELAERYSTELTSRQLMELVLECPHPRDLRLFYHDNLLNTYPSALFWRVGNEGLLAHCLNPHPLMLWPRGPVPEVQGTIDHDLAFRVCPDFGEIELVQDSDQACLAEVSSMCRVPPQGFARVKVGNAVDAYHKNAFEFWGPGNRELFKRGVCLHTGELAVDWLDAEAVAADIVFKILA